MFFCSLCHELLHVWVEDNIKTDSPLWKKYGKENSEVLEHIHLMALQKMIYLKLNRIDILAMLDHSYRSLSTDDYTRAWEIVNDIEGYEAVLNDIADNLTS